MLRFCLLLWLHSVLANASLDIDYSHATAKQVSQFQNCFFLRDDDIAKIPPAAFEGFQPACVKDFGFYALSKINAEQLYFLTPSAFAAIGHSNFGKIPIDALGGARATQMATLDYFTCSNLDSLKLSAIPPDAWIGFKKSCIQEWSSDACAAIDGNRLRNIECGAFSGFKRNIAGIPSRSFREISTCQLKSMNSESIFGACLHLKRAQVAEINSRVFHAVEPQCLKGFSEEVMKGLLLEQFLTLKNLQLNAFTDKQTRNLNADTICPHLDSSRIVQLSNSGINGLTTACTRKTPPEMVSSLTKRQLRSFGDNIEGFGSDHWSRMTPAQVAMLYGTQVMFLSTEACSVMTIEQFSSICRIAVNGIRAPCMSGLNSDLALSIDLERGQLIAPEAVAGMAPEFFRNLRPEIFATWNYNHTKNFQPSVCSQIRPAQFRALPEVSFRGFTDKCVAKWNPILMKIVTFEQLSFLAYGWKGFHDLQFYAIFDRFGADLWKVVEEQNVGQYWKYFEASMWRQADCFKELFSRGFLSYTDGEFTNNWLIMASRKNPVFPRAEDVAPSTFLSHLALSLEFLSQNQLQYVSPSQFPNVTASQINSLNDSQLYAFINSEVPRGQQIRAIDVSQTPQFSVNVLDSHNGYFAALFSCDQAKAVPISKRQAMRYPRELESRLRWCRRPVNDSITHEGENGQRLSDKKRGIFYEPRCALDMNEWSIIRYQVENQEAEFTKNYRPKNVSAAAGCPCNVKVCMTVNAVHGCFEETKDRCTPSVSDQPPFPGHPRTNPPSREKETHTSMSLSGGSIFGIVLTILIVSLAAGGVVLYKRYPDKVEQIRARLRRYGDDTRPLLG